MNLIVERRMSISPADFQRLLPMATGLALVEDRPGHQVFGDDRSRLEVRTAPCPPLRLGSVSLPVLAVTLVFASFSEADQTARLAHFDRIFQRGGG